MFIRDLEYCQLEVSENQFALVNGGGSKPVVKYPPISLPKPATATATVLANVLASGSKSADTTVVVDTLAVTATGSALSATSLFIDAASKS
ncbi:hypothetical protein V0288_20515 [Pannus brasiliensis CCIBt3594]|uniref:Uncharacterized protein n=1 Tax=Pannus brasiliensis CCIBt3594 TaxID=1427578 RepID=A0AAW9R017_9CHRO